MTDFPADIINIDSFDGYQMDISSVNYDTMNIYYSVNDINLFFPVIRDFIPQTVFSYFLMRGKDIDCPIQPTYRAWIVQGAPDSLGSQYVGTKCGFSPLTDIVVDATWIVNRNI